jgi:hypothetical protein
MADWLRLAPPAGGPRAVEEARKAAGALADQLPSDREQINVAKAALVEAERADREQLAESMRRGADAISDTTAIAAAREAVGAAERRLQGRQLAVETASQELGAAIETERDQWLRIAQRDAEKARTRAAKALSELESQLDELGRARALAWWLTPEAGGFDRAHGVPAVGILGDVKSSAVHMANNNPVPMAMLLGWVRELIAPVEVKAQPAASSLAGVVAAQ